MRTNKGMAAMQAGLTDPDLRVGPPSDADRYGLGRLAGAGSEGLLYRGSLVTDSGVVLAVAIKMLHPRFSNRIDALGRRWAEQLELFRSLQAAGMVAVRDVFTGPLPHPPGQADLGAAQTLFLVMNWVEGEPLEDWAARHRQDRPADLLKVLLPVAAALDLAHSGMATGGIPVVHCDVKPANILITTGEQAVLVDPGLTRVLPGGSGSSAVTGTAGYLAPEVVADGRYSPASDGYALGMVAWWLLTGSDPPDGNEPQRHRAELEAALGDQPGLVSHVLAMLDPRPGARPALLANWCAQLRNSSLLPEDPTEPLRPLAPLAPNAQGPSAQAGPIGVIAPITATGPLATDDPPSWRRRLPAIAVLTVLALVLVAVAFANWSRSPATRRIIRSSAAGGLPAALSTTTVPPGAPPTTSFLPPTSPPPSSPPTTGSGGGAIVTRGTTTTAVTTVIFPPTTTAHPPPRTTTTVVTIETGLRARLIDSTKVPSGFLDGGIDDGLVNAPGKLESAGRRWTRPLPGAVEDDISLWVTRFPTTADAVNFNSGFSREYISTLVRTEAVSGVPGSNAYLNNDRTASAWFTVGTEAVGVYVLDHSDDPLGVAEGVARAEYPLLP